MSSFSNRDRDGGVVDQHTSPPQGSLDQKPGTTDPIEVSAAQAGMMQRHLAQWSSAFQRDPYAPALPGLPNVTTEDAATAVATIASLRERVAGAPTDTNLLRELAQALNEISQTGEALKIRREVTALAPNDVNFRLELVADCIHADKSQEALAEALAAYDIEPQNVSVILAVAGCYSKLAEPDLELSYLRLATVSAPDSAQAWRPLAQCLAGAGQLAESLEAWSKVIEISPDDSSAWFQRGLLRQVLGDSRGAEQDLREAIRLKPDDEIIHATLATSLLEPKQGFLKRILTWARGLRSV